MKCAEQSGRVTDAIQLDNIKHWGQAVLFWPFGGPKAPLLAHLNEAKAHLALFQQVGTYWHLEATNEDPSPRQVTSCVPKISSSVALIERTIRKPNDRLHIALLLVSILPNSENFTSILDEIIFPLWLQNKWKHLETISLEQHWKEEKKKTRIFCLLSLSLSFSYVENHTFSFPKVML